MENVVERLRVQANELIGLMATVGNWTGARRLAELLTELGYFPSAVQRPNRYLSGLSACPVHDANTFEVARYLARHAVTIREEVTRFIETSDALFWDVEEPLVEAGGRWQELVFFEAGIRSERVASKLPATAAILTSLPAEVRNAGVVMLSRLGPNTHIVPHCGETNSRLRLHMGIKVPSDALMRVGAETVRWQVDQCIVFDDSFEHEVWNFSAEDRIVLIVDLPHPDAPQQPASAQLPQRLVQLMTDAHLTGLYLDEESGAPRLIPDSFLSGKLCRYLNELGAVRVELDDQAQLRVDGT